MGTIDKDALKSLYQGLLKKGYKPSDIGDESTFATKMTDKENRRQLYNYVASRGDFRIGDYESYEGRLMPDLPSQNNRATKYKDAYDNSLSDTIQPPLGGEYVAGESGAALYADAQQRKDEEAKRKEKEAEQAEQARLLREHLEQSGELQRLDDIKAQAEATMAEQKGGEKWWENLLMLSPKLHSAYKVGEMAYDRLFNDEYRTAAATVDAVEEAQDLIDEAGHADGSWIDRNVGGVFRGIADSGSRISTWDFGATDLADAYTMNQIIEKSEKGEQLSASEQSLLDAMALTSAVQSAYQDQVGNAYHVGSSLPHSAGFMVQMAVNPLSGLGKAAAKKFGTTTAKKIAARLAGDVVGMTGATAVGAGRVAADYYDRLNGSTEFDIDNNGFIRYGGQRDQEEADVAIWKAIGSNFIENYTEAIGDYFSPIGSVISGIARNGVKKAGFNGLIDALDNIKSSQWSRAIQSFKEKAKFDGFLGELMEEEIGMILNAATVGDQSFNPEDPNYIFNPDTQIQTMLSVALMQGTMYAIEAGGSKGGKFIMQNRLNAAERNAAKLWGDRWADLKEQLDNSTMEDRARIVEATKNATDLSQEQIKAVDEYAARLTSYQSFNSRVLQNKEEMTEEAKEAEAAYEAGVSMTQPEKRYAAEKQLEAANTALDMAVNDLQGDAQSEARAGVETVRRMVEDGAGANEVLESIKGISNENVAQLCKNFVYMNERVKGIADGARNQAQEEVEAVRSSIANKVNAEGNVVTATFRDQAVYVLSVSGNNAVVVDDNGKKQMVAVGSLHGMTTTPAAEMMAVYEQQVLNDAIGRLDKDLNHHPKSEAAHPGMVLRNGELAYVVNGITDDGNVEVLPATYDSESKTYVPNSNTNPFTISQADAWALQDEFYAQEEAKTSGDNVSEETAQNEGGPVVENEQSVSEKPIIEGEAVQAGEELADDSASEAAAPATPTLEDIVATLPKKKDNKTIDYSKMTPEQSFAYTQAKRGIEVALQDLQDEITTATEDVAKLEQKVQEKRGAERVQARDELDAAIAKQNALQALYDANKPAAVTEQPAAVTEEVMQPEAENAQIEADADVVTEDEAAPVVTDEQIEKAEPVAEEEVAITQPKGVMSEQEFINSMMEDAYANREDQSLTKEEWLNSDESTAIQNQIADSYGDYLQGLKNDGTLQQAYDNASIGDKIKIREAIETAGFNVDEMVDTTKEKQDAKAKRDEKKRKRREELMRKLGINPDGTIMLVEDENGEIVDDNGDGTTTRYSIVNKDGTDILETTEQTAKEEQSVEEQQVAEEQEDILAMAERIAKEEQRRKPLRERIKEWEKNGIKVNVLERVEDVPNRAVRAEISNGSVVPGWYEETTGEVYILLPHVKDLHDLDVTILHEAVSHKGLRVLLGEERFNALCDKVWDMMPKSLQDYFEKEYPGVKDIKDPVKRRRAAADEHMAFLAQEANLTPEEKTMWDKIVELFREIFDGAVNGLLNKSTLTNKDLAELIQLSYANLRSGANAQENVGDGTRFRSLEEINSTFNEELQKQIDGTLSKGHVYQLGSPSAVLLSTGIADVPIELSSTRLEDKSRNFGHDYELSELKDLVNAIHKPVAVFSYGDKSKAQNIIVEIQHEGKNFIVGLSIRPSVGGRVLDVNSIRNVFPKDNAEWLNWISQGKMLYADKERIQNLIAQQRTNLADVDYLDLDSVANIVKDFQNPKLPEEKTAFRVVYHGSGADFNSFDHSFMGTGEGAQSYGWGTYVTDVEGIAKKYGEAMKPERYKENAVVNNLAKEILDDYNGDKEGALEYLRSLLNESWSDKKRVRKEIKIIESGKFLPVGKAHLYEVDIPDNDGTNYLEWDKPLSEENKKRIKEAVLNSQMYKDYADKYGEDISLERLNNWLDAFDTGRAYRLLENFADINDSRESAKQVSMLLSDAGFVGIEVPTNYMSGGNTEGTKNYVIFNEHDLDIVEHTRFRQVVDPLKIAELETGEKVKVYRAMQLVDGKLYPPMSAKVNGKMREPIELGRWEEAEEMPELADKNGYFRLNKGNSKSLKARYNPYIHTSTTPLNDQFSSAQDRPELVTVEVEIPASELTSGYKAEKAKDAVGKLEWKAGVVQGKLSGTRTVILSRWDKPIRIVPDSEVADEIVKMFGDKQITMPSNVVTPSLRAELEKRGVPFVETDNQGKEIGGTRFRATEERVALRDSEESKAIFDTAKKEFGTTIDMREAGYILPDGSMLDFSDKKNGGSRGERVVDHREIRKISTDEQPIDMGNFIDRGAVRIDLGAGAINLNVPPTLKQKDVLRRLIDRNDGYVYVDFGNGWETEHYVEYEDVKPMRVLGDIDRYYTDGIKPEGVRFRVSDGVLDAQIGEMLREYDEDGVKYATPMDLAKGLEEILDGYDGEESTTELYNILYDYQRDQAESRQWGDRMDAGGDDVFVERLFDYMNSAARFRVSDAPFYSNAERAVENVKQEKATPQQWLAMIEKGGGLKAGEDKWLGLSDWLKASDAKSLTKQEVLDYIKANQIQIEEVNYGEATFSRNSKINLESELKRDDVNLDNVDDIENVLSEWDDEFGDSKLFEYQNGYFDIDDKGNIILNRKSTIANPIDSTREENTTKGLKDKREIALVVPTIEPYSQSDDIHFGDAGDGRAVAWVRFGETTDADGSRVLVIDEIQSKRHQDGKKKGYFDTAAHRRRTNELNEELDNVVEKRMKLIESLRSKYPNGYMKTIDWVDDNGMMQRKMVVDENKVTNDEYNSYNDLSQKIVNLHLVLHDHNKSINWRRVPAAPFEKNWSELVMKRMLRYAAENGFDKVAWTKGEQQVKRYDLSKVIDELHADEWRKDEHGFSNKPNDEIKEVYAALSNGGELQFIVNREGVIVNDINDAYKGRTLKEVFGKDIAIKLMGEDKVVLNDAQLVIGDKGMRGFYDNMLPSFMNKYGKKWGVKVGEVELPHVEEAGRTMWSVDVTDAMKESVMEGQPMFRVTDGGLTDAQVRALELVTGKSRAEVVKEYGGKRKRSRKDDVTAWRDEQSKHTPMVKDMEVIGSAMDIVRLKGVSIKDKLFLLNQYLFNKDSVGGYIPDGDKVVCFASRIDKKRYAVSVMLHEYTHRVVEKMYDEGRISDEDLDFLLAYCRKYYPKSYKAATNNFYKKEMQPHEIPAYLMQELYGKMGDKLFENNTFARKSVLNDLFRNIINELKNEEGTTLPPDNHRQGDGFGETRGANDGVDTRRGNEIAEEQGVQGNAERTDGSGTSSVSEGTEGTRFRVSGGAPLATSTIEAWDELASSALFQLRETAVDFLTAVEKFQDLIAKKTKSKILDFENAYQALLHLSSVNKEAMDWFDSFVVKPMNKVISKLTDGDKSNDWSTGKLRELVMYVQAKHGLERNRQMAVEKAAAKDKKTQQSVLDAWKRSKEAIQSNSNLTWKEQQEQLDAEAIKLGADLTQDHSGLSDKKLFGDEAVYKDGWQKAAYDHVEAYEQANKAYIDELWRNIRNATEYSLNKQLECGLVDKEYVETQQGRFQYYVPLRGFGEEIADEVYSYINEKRREGSPVKRAKGRVSEADNPFGGILQVAYSSIAVGNKNLAKQKLLNLVQNHNTEGLVAVNKGWIVKFDTAVNDPLIQTPQLKPEETAPEWVEALPVIPQDATAKEISAILASFEERMKELKEMSESEQISGKVKTQYRTLHDQLSEHQVVVMVGGNPYLMTITGNPRLAQAVNGLLNPNTGKEDTLLESARRVQRFMAGAFTSHNFAFSFANLVRDTMYANNQSFIKEHPAYWARFTYHQRLGFGMWPKMIQYLYKYQKGTLDTSVEAQRLFKEFMENGGATGYTFVETQKEAAKKLAEELKKLGNGETKLTMKAIGKALLDCLEFMGQSAELINRFTAFRTSREMGRSISRSITDAKEITVNFNRKGAGKKTEDKNNSKLVNAAAAISHYGREYILFWNANMQSKYRFVENLKEHPLKTSVTLIGNTMMLGGLMIPILNDMVLPALYSAFGMGGDDDEEEYYDVLTDWERTHNICIRLPKGNWLKLPLSPEMVPFYSMGDIINGNMSGKRPFEASDYLKSVIDVTSPISVNWSYDGWKMSLNILPTVAQPVFQNMMNVNFMGNNIAKESMFNRAASPEFRNVYKSASSTLVGLSKLSNELTGGSFVDKGVANWNPAYIQNLISGYTGGYGTTLLAASDWIVGTANNEPQAVIASKFPLVSRFFISGNKDIKQRRLDSRYYDVVDFCSEIERQLRDYRQGIEGKHGDIFTASQAKEAMNKLESSEDFARYQELKDLTKEIKRTEDMLKEHGEDELTRGNLNEMKLRALEILDIDMIEE